jgi:TonB family protein
MRNKINIMKKHPDITDEELERFKNFDSLLNKHYRILNEKKPTSWKIIVPTVILIGSVVFYWIINNNDLKPVITDTAASDNVTLLDKKENDKSIETTSPAPKNNGREDVTREKANATQDEIKAIPSDEQKIDSVTNPKVGISAVAQNDPNPDNSPKPAVVYVQAEPIDGYEALYAYFSKELIYPEAAVKDSVEGVLIVKFLINKEGKPEQIQTSGSLGVLFEKEAVRLIEHMPLWKPATLNGKPVSSKLSIPLTFQLQKK